MLRVASKLLAFISLKVAQTAARYANDLRVKSMHGEGRMFRATFSNIEKLCGGLTV